jgi:predicted outer membrane protein
MHQGTSDQQIAACIAGAAQNEIEIAKFAEPRLQTEEAMEFAQRMVREHTPGFEALKQRAGELATTLRTSPVLDEAAAVRRDTAPGAEPRVAPGVPVPGVPAPGAPATGAPTAGLDWISIHQQIAEQCLASVKKELASLQGTDIDKAFIGMQCLAHLELIDKLKVLRNYASNELRQNIDQELQLANTHLTQAKQIKEQLKDRSSDRLSRRPDSAK